MPVTQQDIAKELGVSRRLVSYALNGENRVGAEMRARILSVADELGYQTNRAAKTLVTGRTHQIGLCVTSLSHPFPVRYVHEFELLASKSPYDLIVTRALTRSMAVDGVLYYNSHPPEVEVPYPVVALLSPPYWHDKESKSLCGEVRLDLTVASGKVMEHLLEQGMRRIAFVSFEGLLLPQYNEHRRMVYRETMCKAGLQPELIPVPVPEDENFGARKATQDALQKYFSEHPLPEALFCLNDDIAIGAYRTLWQLGLRIPQDIAVVGCDNILGDEDMFPALTSIQMPWEDMCRRAWEMLLARIETPDLQQQQASFEGALVVRESSMRGKSTFTRRKG